MLTPEAVEDVLRLTERDEVREQQEKLTRERTDNEKKLRRLVEAIGNGREVASLWPECVNSKPGRRRS